MISPPPIQTLQAELTAQRQALEALAKGTPLPAFLTELCLTLETLLEDGRCSVLLLDEDGISLRHGAGPHLEPAYLAGIDGLPIGPQTGSCGTAMFRKTPVVVEDIAQDPLWAPYKDFTLPFGMRACASVPVLASDQQVLGAFAIYRDIAGPFPSRDMDLLHRFSAITALAIEGHLRTTRLREEEERHRALVTQSQDSIFYFDAQTLRILEANQALVNLVGYSLDELKGMRLPDLVAHDLASIQNYVDLTLERGNLSIGERLYRHKNGETIPVDVCAAILPLRGRSTFSVVARDLRTGKASEQAIATREAQLQAVMEQAGDAIFIASPEGLYLHGNPQALALTGYSLEELTSLHINDLISKPDQAVQPIRWNELHEGKILLVERLIRRKDGSEFPMELSARQLSDGRLIAVGRDITLRRLADEALRLKASELQEAQALGRIGSWVYDLLSGETRWSEEMYALTGHQGGIPFTLEQGERYFDPDGSQHFKERLTRLITTGKVEVHEQAVLHPDGSQRILRSVIHPVLLDQRVVGLRGVLQDVTEIRAAEQAVIAHQRAMLSLFELSPTAMVLTNPANHTVLMANSAALALFQISPEEVQGQSTLAFFANPEDRTRILATLDEHGEARDITLELRIKGKSHWVLFSSSVLTYQGEPAILSSLLDITARQREEEDLRQHQKLESLGVLAGGIAHDFNNLLTAIMGNLSLATLNLPQGSKAQHYLKDMEKAVHRAADLARQMLAYSGKGRFRQEVLDLNHLVREMTHLLSVCISKHTRLHLDLAKFLPALEGDPVQLQQVVMNLVTNANEAIAGPEGHIRVHTATTTLSQVDLKELRLGHDLPPGDYLMLEVEDTGSGMSQETLEKLFDPFFTTKATGRGLGLSAILGILRGHRAGLAITSVLGKGTRFRIYFRPAAATPTAPPPVHPDESSPLRGRVLVVDDEAPIRATLAGMLGLVGMESEEAVDGLDALERLHANAGRFTCVVLDLTMPRLGGRETLKRIREEWPDLPVILSSGYSQQEDELALSSKETFLGKPYRMGDLKAALSRVIPGLKPV